MTTRTAAKVATGVMPKSLRVGLVTVTATFCIGAGQSLSAGDVIQMVKVPQGATPVYVAISGNAVGVGLLKVGDGVSNNRYLTGLGFSATMKQAVINTSYIPYTYSTDDTIDVTISTVSLTSVGGAFNLTAIFAMDT